MALPALSYGERAFIISNRSATVQIIQEGMGGFTINLPPFSITPLDADQSVASSVDSAVTAGDVRFLIRRLPAL